MENIKESVLVLACAALLMASATSTTAHANNDQAAKRAAVINHWTPERRAAAQPRDLVIDHRGLGYLRRTDGSLSPYGHQIAAAGRPTPNARPGGSENVDSTAPFISNMAPDGVTIGSNYKFSATVSDASGVRSVTFVITYPDGTNTQSFSASNAGGDTWTVGLSGFSNGNWSWHVVAKDGAKKGGNTATSEKAYFAVSTAGVDGGGGDSTGIVTNAAWTQGGAVETAVGRLFYEMPSNPRRKRWSAYVCSGTVVQDNQTGRSIILTASHCVYDDANNAFARNVLFIPNQAGTSGSGTDSNCNNDPLGCWVADFGVVDTNWTTRTFPDNVAWDYAFYVVDDDATSHQGAGEDVLDLAAETLSIEYTAPIADDSANDGPGAPDYTQGMGYSYSEDPNFMYCAEDMQDMDAANWWLPSCDLSGGSSGGPWIQPFNVSNGTGPIISVNSWGYTTSPGMAGPKLSGTSAACVFSAARANAMKGNVTDGDAGYSVTCGQ